ncbi:hypothetical protein CDAR_187761, partial [Caerostris darwini]
MGTLHSCMTGDKLCGLRCGQKVVQVTGGHGSSLAIK